MVWLLAAAMMMANPVVGDWMSPTGSVVRVYECGADVCLKVVKLPPDAPGTNDGHNPDTSLRSRPICGLEIGSGFKADGDGKYSGGKLYDPASGRTYKGSMVGEGDVLKLRGYVGLAAFGRTESWKKVAPVAACQ